VKRILVISLLLISISNAYSQARTEIKMYKTFGGARFEMDTLVLSPKQVLQVLKTEPLAYEKFKRAKANYNAAGILGFAGGLLIGLPIGTAIGGGNPEWGLAAAGGVLVMGSFSLTAVFRSHAFEAVELYNGKTARIKPQVQFCGIGVRIALRF